MQTFRISLFMLPCLVLGCVHTKLVRTPAAVRPPLLLIGTTDFHGAIDSTTPAFAAMKEAYVKAAGPNQVVHVDAGDLFQGSMLSNMAEGTPVIALYNYLNVDAVAVGNHDFDYGPVGEKSIAGIGALLARMRESSFRWYGHNISDKTNLFDGAFVKSGESASVLTKGNLRIGIIGLAAPETPLTTDRRNLTGLDFEPMKETVERLVPTLRDITDYIIVVAHSGSECKDNSLVAIEDLSTCGNHGLIELAKSLEPGLVDAFVGGHTHRGVFKKINGAMVMQGFAKGQYLAVTWLGHNPSPTMQTGLVPVSSSASVAGFPLDIKKHARAIDKLMQPYLEKVNAKAVEPLDVTLPQPLKRSFSEENALGSAMVDVLAREFPEYDAVLLNNGSFRSDLPAGPLTYKNIYDVFPFDNLLAEVEVTAEQFKRMVLVGVSPIDGGLSWSGFKYKYGVEAAPPGMTGKVCPTNITWFSPKLEKSVYRVLTTDFITSGGVGFDRIQFLKKRDLVEKENLRDSLAKAIKNQSHFLRSYKFKKRRDGTASCPPESI